MNKSERKQVMIMIGVMLAIVIILLIVKSTKGDEQESQPIQNTVQNEAYVERQEDGTSLNVSNKIKETKKLGDLEFSNIRLTSKNGESYLTATVKNTSSVKTGDEFITITVLDENGNTLTSVYAYLGTIDAGQETTLSTKTSSDFANAYDFTVSR